MLGGLGLSRRLPREPMFKPFSDVTKKSGYELGYECEKTTEVDRGSISLPVGLTTG